MISKGIDSTSTVLHTVIAGGTGMQLAQPDQTTNIITAIVQILSIVLLFFKNKSTIQSVVGLNKRA